MAIKYFPWPLNDHEIDQEFPLQNPPKFTKIGIFGLKANHLATLIVGLAPGFYDRELQRAKFLALIFTYILLRSPWSGASTLFGREQKGNYFSPATRVARWYVFKPKILIWVYFGRPRNGKCWYILWPLGIHCGNRVYFMAIW
jgi:hypothetical protein